MTNLGGQYHQNQEPSIAGISTKDTENRAAAENVDEAIRELQADREALNERMQQIRAIEDPSWSESYSNIYTPDRQLSALLITYPFRNIFRKLKEVAGRDSCLQEELREIFLFFR